MLSTKEEALTKANAFAAGANDYLVKLPDKLELIARIRYHSRGYINLLQRNEAYEELLKSQQALASELSVAADHVISLLPSPISGETINTEWCYVPSTQLGGDSFGYHWIDGDHFAMYLLDVCDHGVGSALLSVSTLNVLRSQSLPATDFKVPEDVLTGLNEAFQMEDHNNLYFTIWYGVLNTESYELRYASGGHPPAFLISGSGETTELITPNILIGAMPGSTYKGNAVQVERPSRLYIFSDGVYEVYRQDGTMWSLKELNGYLVDPPATTEPEIDSLYSFVREMSENEILDDDFSMLKISFL